MEDKEFFEEDVWGVANKEKEKVDSGKKVMRMSKDSSGGSAPRKIPKGNDAKVVQGSFSSSSSSSSSAPMGIPDWSKIYGKKWSSKGGCVYNKDHYHHGNGVDEDEYGDDDGDMIPPHEWLARKLARSQISSFSMCEGMGRTLKGRDLSKVRNAILTKTGFIE